MPVLGQPSPSQPAKVEPAAAVAVRVTDVPSSKVAEHVAPQLIPPGLLLTVPCPPPCFATVSKRWVGVPETLVNVAVTVRAWFIVTVHVSALPEQLPPLHPLKVEPESALAVSVTLAPLV